MPAFAWLVKNSEGMAVMSKPLPHTCFAQVPAFVMRTLGTYGVDPQLLPEEKFILYASCHGSFEDAQLFVDKVNESVLSKYPFTLTAHKYDTEGNPFADKRFEGISCPSYYSPKQKVSYWALEWPAGTQWNLVYAVTKLLFKNITYGNRDSYGDTHKEMMRILREGGNIFEAMVYSSQYLGNGYGYPMVYRSKQAAEAVYKFTQEGPTFQQWADAQVLGDGQYVNTGGNHSPIQHLTSATSLKKTYGGVRRVGVPLSQLRADLLEAAGITNGTV